MILGLVSLSSELVNQKVNSFFLNLEPPFNSRVFEQISCRNAQFGISDQEEKSFIHYSDELLFVSEGRIDNRSELSAILNLPPSCPDSHLIYEAYKKWSGACIHKLIGDWAFVAYNARTQDIFLARDQHGYTSLYVYQDENIFAFSSSIRHLIHLSKPEPNHKFIVGRLCQWNRKERHETIFDSIYKVSAGYTLSYRNKQLQFEKYWFPENISLRNYHNLQDYTDEFFEILRESIRCRLKSNRPFASMLSGGFDSGTVSILAAELLGKARLTTFSHIPQFPDKLPPPTKNVFFDETPYIDASASAMPNIHSVKLTSRSISPLKGIEKFIDAFDNIIHGASNAYWFIDLYENVSHQGFGVLLSGENGNAGMSYKGIADLLPFYHPYYLSSPQLFFKKKLVSPLLNKFLTQRRHTKSINFQINDGVVNEDALKESGIYEDIENNPDMYSVSLNNHQHHMLKLIDLCRRYRLIGEISNYYGFSYRDPTADIRLLEFCLSVPNEIHFNSRGQNKALIRKVMQGRLPQRVLRETKTGKQSADIYFRIQQDLPQMEEWISVLSKNQRFVHLIDINKLKTLFVLIKNGKLTDTLSINRLLKALMSGIFLEKRGFN